MFRNPARPSNPSPPRENLPPQHAGQHPYPNATTGSPSTAPPLDQLPRLQKATFSVTFCDCQNPSARFLRWTANCHPLDPTALTSGRPFLDDLVSKGRHHFTTAEAVAALGSSLVATRAVLRRLKARGELASPLRSFHVILPPEYRRLGCLPPDQFVHQVMHYLDLTYYVALLSAAELHGAAHQRPQAFQVMVESPLRAIECGSVRMQFFVRQDLRRTPTLEKNTPRGPIRVATAEATALELVGYAGQCGGLDHVASVLAELAPAIDPTKLVETSAVCPTVWVQRLGYLLDQIEHPQLADALVPSVAERSRQAVPLQPSASSTGAPRSARWNLVVNAEVTREP